MCVCVREREALRVKIGRQIERCIECQTGRKIYSRINEEIARKRGRGEWEIWKVMKTEILTRVDGGGEGGR